MTSAMTKRLWLIHSYISIMMMTSLGKRMLIFSINLRIYARFPQILAMMANAGFPSNSYETTKTNFHSVPL
jgi:hypothetical protein